MMVLSENYRNRLKVLAGILSEVDYKFSEEEKENAFIGFENRVKYNKDLMVRAIKEGWEVGMLFWSKNDKYQMRTYKARTICPVALGLSKKGNPVVRAFHKVGQSESAGLRQKAAGAKTWRSAEAKDEWRLFKTANISRMWLTGRFFQVNELKDSKPGAGFSSGNDKGMSTAPEIQYNSSEAKKFQDQYNKKAAQPVEVVPVNPPAGEVAAEPQVPNTTTKPIRPIKPLKTGGDAGEPNNIAKNI
jgi:hypothetical protein